MSSVEIEDVLSSIRRLVSEDMRPSTVAPAAAPAMQAAPAPQPAVSVAEKIAPKLILTPALRVVADEAPAAATDPVAEPWDDGEVAAFVNVEDDAVFDDDSQWQQGADVVSLTLAEQAPAAQPVSEPVPEIAPQAVDAADDLEPEVAWQPEADVTMADWEQALPEDAYVAPDPAEVVVDPAEMADDPAQDAIWADAAEAEVLRQLAEDGPAPQTPPLSDDDMVYEENLLRDLVRDIIREELQGELGERITRNVRKLVRAEIARAMALRDFD
jgi:hypothetical protein